MRRFTEGDRVRVDIPDETDPDHDAYHGVHGTITTILEDDAGEVIGDKQDTRLYRLSLDTDETVDFRGWDLRPPVE